jgi:hypothetical protein
MGEPGSVNATCGDRLVTGCDRLDFALAPNNLSLGRLGGPRTA